MTFIVIHATIKTEDVILENYYFSILSEISQSKNGTVKFYYMCIKPISSKFL